MDVLKEFEIGGIRIELTRGDDTYNDHGAKWSIGRGDSVADATAMDVLALMLIIGAEMDRDDE